jgi:hypothetical protein
MSGVASTSGFQTPVIPPHVPLPHVHRQPSPELDCGCQHRLDSAYFQSTRKLPPLAPSNRAEPFVSTEDVRIATIFVS